MQDEARIEYIPGKGRGNLSSIKYNLNFHDEVKIFVKECINSEKLENVIQLLQFPIPQNWIAEVTKDLTTLFGLSSISTSRDILRTIFTRKITTLDPLFSSIAFECFLICHMGDTLTVYDEKSDSVKPHLAHHWKVDKEYRKWTFYLRKSIQFHNHQIMTSGDVKFSFERFKSEESPHMWLVEEIESIECLSDYTIRFNLTKPNPFFLRYVSFENLVILPRKEVFSENRWIGSGPFQLKKRTDNKLVLSAFDNYFLQRPLLDEIEMYRIPPRTEQAISFQLRGMDDNYIPEERHDIETGVRILHFNFRRNTIVQDKYFREAVYHIMDVKKMAGELKSGSLVAAGSFHPRNRTEIIKEPGKIKSLLKKSAYGGETLTVYAIDAPRQKIETEWFKKEALSYGINLDIKDFSLNELYINKIEKNADLFFLGEIASNDYHLSFISAFKSRSLLCSRFFREKDLAHIEKYLDKIKFSKTREVRDEMIQDVEEYIRKNNLLIFTYHPIKNKTFHPMIKNIQAGSFGLTDFRKLWIE